MGTVELKLGDMFDGPSDLIVLPCSTAGTVTPFVYDKLSRHRIMVRPERKLILGDLHVHPFVGVENISQFVAYAASVKGSSSTIDAINQIGIKFGEQTIDNDSIRLISAPLLGSGAGHLDEYMSFRALSEGFILSSHKDARLSINVLRRSTFKNIETKSNAIESEHRHTIDHTPQHKPPRVFISYSHGEADHNNWVSSIGNFLRQNGVDARLDIWHLRRGMDLPQFMTNGLTLADRVILISDETYAQKADGRLGGVGWETMIIQGDLAKLSPDNTKYLVIVRSNNIQDGTPIYLKTKFAIHWSSASNEDTNKKVLLREIFDAVTIPPIGQKPLSL